MRNGWCTSIPILIAPVAGFPRVRTTQSLQTSRELPVERIIRHLEARGQLIDLSTVQLEQLQDGRRCDPLGAIHPLVRGANTSQFRGDEVEIARIQLESTPEDVISISAKIGADRIRYSIVDEYNTEFEVSQPSSTSLLSLAE